MLRVVIVHIYSNAGLERHRYVMVLWALIKGSTWLVARASSLSGQKSCLSTPQPHSLVGQSWCVWYVCGEGIATQLYPRSCSSNFPSWTCGPQGVPRRFLTQHSQWDPPQSTWEVSPFSGCPHPSACSTVYGCKTLDFSHMNYNWDQSIVPMEGSQKPWLRDKDLNKTQSLPSRNSQYEILDQCSFSSQAPAVLEWIFIFL